MNDSNKMSIDCLKMKDDAQVEILAETEGMTPDEYRAYLRKSIENGPLASFYRELTLRADNLKNVEAH